MSGLPTVLTDREASRSHDCGACHRACPGADWPKGRYQDHRSLPARRLDRSGGAHPSQAKLTSTRPGLVVIDQAGGTGVVGSSVAAKSPPDGPQTLDGERSTATS